MISRRDALKIGMAGAGASLVAGCAPTAFRAFGSGLAESYRAPKATDSYEVGLVRRCTFGADLETLATAEQLGGDAWLEQQLGAGKDDGPLLASLLNQCDTERLDANEAMDLPRARVLQSLEQASLLRAVYSPNQLYEQMAQFWRNHFSLFGSKGDVTFFSGPDEAALREHTFGNFFNLLRVSAHSPAMLTYLDNPANFSGHPNENYAREVMELHTLGVRGGYSQHDVMEVARCLTGWTWERRFLKLNKGKFRFDPEKHDQGEKTVLGHKIPRGGGVDDGERVLEILAHHPATGRYIASKLSLQFLGVGEGKVVDEGAKAFTQSGGEIKPTLRAILSKSAVLGAKPIAKRPFEFVAGTFRATRGESGMSGQVLDRLAAMGHLPYGWAMPNGYPLSAEHWAGTLLERWNFASDYAHGSIRGVRHSLDSLVERTEGRTLGEKLTLLTLGKRFDKAHPLAVTLSRIQSPEEGLALCLSSNEFQWRA